MFDSNIDQEPLQFEIGAGKVIPGFDDAVTGLAEGEKRKQRVPADKAYGTALALLVLNSHEYLAVVASRVSCILLFHNARQSILPSSVVSQRNRGCCVRPQTEPLLGA